MATPSKTAPVNTSGAAKPDLGARAVYWLPYLAAFMCLLMLAIATISLFDVNAEPESPASAKVTSIAANGYAGLRRLLEARGATVALDRFEDGSKDVDRGDLEIVTLDDDAGVFDPNYDGSTGDDSSASDASAADSSAASDSAGPGASDGASGESASLSTTQRRVARMMRGQTDADVPDIRRVEHLLQHPDGRAVLVVAPKWMVAAATGPQSRWGQGADLLPADSVAHVLDVLEPLRFHTVARVQTVQAGGDKAQATGTNADDSSATQAVFTRMPYQITHTAATQPVVLTPAGDSPLTGALNAGKIDRLQSITAPNLTPVITEPHGEALLSRVTVINGPQPKTPVYLLSDPDLLDNQIMSDPQRTATALNLIAALTPPVAGKPAYVFNLTFNGLSVDHDLMHALSRPPYLAVPLSLLILALGLMWAAFARFGPPQVTEMRPALGRGVRILADNAARLMGVTLKETKLGPAYAQLMRDQVLKIRGYRQIDARESADALADRISQIYRATHSYSDLKARAAKVVTVHQLIDVARLLHAWKTEIGKIGNGGIPTGQAPPAQTQSVKTETELANR